jgi:Family of unknown function (DUF6152)
LSSIGGRLQFVGMLRLTAVLATAFLASAPSLDAHHSISGVYDAGRAVTIDGVISAFHFVNPHPYVEIDVQEGEAATHWRVELDNRYELAAVGVTATTLRPGDRVVVTGSAARDGSKSLYARSLQRKSDGFLYEQVGTSPRVTQPRAR